MSNVYVIAEIGLNGNGSVDLTKKLIDVAKDNGVDAVKFQKRTINKVYTQQELDTPRESPWGTTTRQQKEGLEFNRDQYDQIDQYCREVGIDWFMSAWDMDSLDFAESYQPKFHKVASALLTNRPFLEKLASLRGDTADSYVILSTGMSTEKQIDTAVDVLGQSLHTILHCTSTYPTKPEEMNMRYIETLASRYPFAEIGFSNHYSGVLWAPIAVSLGARMLEFHITLDRTMYGSDQAASIEPDGVKKLMEAVRLSQQMIGNGIKEVYDSEVPIIKKLRKVSSF